MMKLTALSLILSLGSITYASSSSSSTTAEKCKPHQQLKHWPRAAAKQLDAMIAANAHKGRYACFDMDNTSYQFDLEESLLPFLENKGILSRAKMDPSLQLIPFRDTPTHNETLYSYYNRLCEVEDALCYPFAAQIFSGIPLRRLKGFVDELMALNKTIPTTYYDPTTNNLTATEISPPKIFRGQVELYNKLTANGIEVYVVSASSEELVRMVASDPRYGYNVKPENVIGVTLLLKNTTSGDVTSSRKQIADGTYSEEMNLRANDMVMTPFLWAPATWKTGKWAAILSYIDEWKKPVLVGGDTPASDGPMQFHGVDVARGGIHLWIDRKPSYLKQLKTMMKDYAKEQNVEGVPVTADKNWVIVKPEEIL